MFIIARFIDGATSFISDVQVGSASKVYLAIAE